MANEATETLDVKVKTPQVQSPVNTNRRDAYQRMGVKEFKDLIGASSIEVLRNLNTDTNKLFIGASNGKNYKCQQNIDLDKPLEFLIVNGIVEDACLINKGNGGAEVLAEL